MNVWSLIIEAFKALVERDTILSERLAKLEEETGLEITEESVTQSQLQELVERMQEHLAPSAPMGCISLLRMCQKIVKMKKLVKLSNKDEVNKMTPSDQQQLKAHLKAVAKILYRNTEPTDLKSFESIEKSVRQKMLSEVDPEIGNFFFQQYQEFKQEKPEK